MHWNRWRKHGDPLKGAKSNPPSPCKIDGCPENAKVRGWCTIHYERWRRTGDPLLVKQGGEASEDP